MPSYLQWVKSYIQVMLSTSGGKSQAYKINPVLFPFVLCFLAATKTLFKRNEKINNLFVKFEVKIIVKHFIVAIIGFIPER